MVYVMTSHLEPSQLPATSLQAGVDLREYLWDLLGDSVWITDDKPFVLDDFYGDEWKEYVARRREGPGTPL